MAKNCNFIEKLRETGLRPTRQRVKICKLLYNRETTFHFTINDLVKKISEEVEEKISLATVYNTVHALKTKGYLKEISINTDRSYFDTNISHHHHFFDKSTEELIDLSDEDVEKIQIKKSLLGKKISSVEVLVKVENE
ncbi:transcriptional repressor [Candidatus Pelagibacter sp.]|jgi:Fur family iron response transcriptional regulator|nr:transcriptional repressor [Candidatus Pelagibacter sp.]MDA9768073.1 transcriptional repressor [Candidatus Pelagibacter sp.]MDA9880845.1 transcriptional repressor [Candidatus Pelagibacter sp.]MDA9890255.1 transcriptional repressor [Candidatus Pelagibacter sp.]MDB3897718.1 transcriptional repressor [Candidatus Pelagibacter sp.]|tara:strand:+ start:131 stop:544 length:414 start_codon:yes stop_codon:yes gene_type:complete